MGKLCDLMGHSNRVLSMALSSDEETIVSAGADEILASGSVLASTKRIRIKTIKSQKNVILTILA
jgi:hypothetical protein